MSKSVIMAQWEQKADQFAATAFGVGGESALDLRTLRGPECVIREMPLCGLLTLRSDASNGSLQRALKRVLKLDPPMKLRSTEQGEFCLRWMSPDEWLLSCPIDQVHDIESQLSGALEGHAALVNVSCGYQRMEIEGSDAVTLLQKSTGYDVHPSNLTAGKVVNTTFAKTQVTLRCIDVDQYELIVRRSYADYCWQWIMEAVR